MRAIVPAEAWFDEEHAAKRKAMWRAHRLGVPNQTGNRPGRCCSAPSSGALCRFSGWLPMNCMAIRLRFAMVWRPWASGISPKSSATTLMWRSRPEVYLPVRQGRGRPQPAGACRPRRPADVCQRPGGCLPATPGRQPPSKKAAKARLSATLRSCASSKSRGNLPGPDLWLIIRRNLDDPSEVKFYFSNAPAHTPLTELRPHQWYALAH